jgi:hypothetical protein
MKNLMVAFIALSAVTSLHAQTAHREVPVTYNSTHAATETASSYSKTLYSIHIKAVRNFKQSYQHINDETWFTIPKGYRARFVEKGIRHDVTYDKKGNWLYTIRQYKEDLFPRDIRAQVKSIYYDYSIILVEEIERPRKSLVYVVHMEDRYTLKNVQVCDKEIETVLEIKKI